MSRVDLTVHIAMVAWVPFSAFLFTVLPPGLATIVGLLGAWLLLPVHVYEIQGLPDYNRTMAGSLGVLIGALGLHLPRILLGRPAWPDLSVAVYCLAPLLSSLSNNLGIYDGMSGAVSHLIVFGVPYAAGRLWFGSRRAHRALAQSLVVTALLYVPLCLWEIRMSPQLHSQLYGFAQGPFKEVLRFGGYRPMVFMQHGLALGMMLTSASLVAFWLWRARSVRTLLGVPFVLLVAALLITAILSRSLGALALLFLGIVVLHLGSWTRRSSAIVLLALLPATYILARSLGWSGGDLVDGARRISEERAGSLQTRLWNEDQLLDRALERPAFGWSGWGRARVRDEYGKDVSITDGLWIITVGNFGLVGLVAVIAVSVVPILLLATREPPGVWSRRSFAPTGALAVVLALQALDNLFNAMLSPAFPLIAGGLTSYSLRGASLSERVARKASWPDRRVRGEPAALASG